MGPLKLVPLGYAQVTATSSAASLPSIPSGAQVAIISVETAGIRWRDDQTAPTASVGMPIAAGAAPYEYWGNVSAFEIIAQTGSPVVDVSYYRIAG